jgi:RND family efflux transporter MFP subunit
MKKIVLLIISVSLVLFFIHCGNGDGKGDEKQHMAAAGKGDKAHSQNADAKKGDQQGGERKWGRRGQRSQSGEGGKKGQKGEASEKFDLNSSEIPERMRQAIKSGRISKERAMQMLARRRGGGDAPSVKIEPVKRTGINAFLVLNGVVEPERKVDVHARLSAYVKQIVREEGDFVKKNDVLALLDDTEIRISYRESQIRLEQAKLTLDDEEKNNKRSQELMKKEMISEQDFQTAQASYNKAKLDYQTRQENFKDLELQLSYTRLRSPAEGYVTQRMIEVGSRVTNNQQVYVVEDFSPLLVKVYVPTSDVVNLETGMAANVFTDVLQGMVFNGKIKLINPRIDVQSGTVKVTVEVFDKTRKLKPGMFVETKILISNNPKALVIPKKCVSYRNNQAFIFVFDRQARQVAKRIIKTGISEGDNIEVLDGLEEGERIVTVGVAGLKDKMKVKVVR